MSPVAPSSGHAGRALTISAIAIVIVMGVLYLASMAMSRQPSANLKIGDATFQGGSAKRLAKEIRSRGPILYPDVSGRARRDILLQHIGDNENKGWYSFIAQPEGKPRDCTWKWRSGSKDFVASCDKTLTAPANGKGLESFPVTVTKGRLDVDLNYAERATTTSSSSTTTTVVISGQPKAGG